MAIAAPSDGRQLLERDGEQRVISALVADTPGGSGVLAVIEGPAGIGKSRLLDAAVAAAHHTGLRVLAARGAELERQYSFGVVRQLCEPLLARATAAERVELFSGAAAQSMAVLGTGEREDAPAPLGTSFASLHGLYWLIANLCARQPVLLCVDDLHWADYDSLRFLAYLLPRLDGLPLLVLVALRPAEPGADQHLLDLLTTYPKGTTLHPGRLSVTAAARLVRAAVGEADEAFCAACHTASGGNPLLLQELAAVAAAEGITPNVSGIARLAEVGPRATGRRVALRLARLGPEATALAAAVAVLGDGAELASAAALAGLELVDALRVTDALAAVEILGRSAQLGFVHPMVRAAVYESLPVAQRTRAHADAARLLADTGAPSERVASHLLRVPPAGDAGVVAALRRAAGEAAERGSAEAALTYLERCLREPPSQQTLPGVLYEAGAIAQLVDMAKATAYLGDALALAGTGSERALIAEALGRALFFRGRGPQAVHTLSQAVSELEDEHTDLQLRLEAGLVNACISDPALHELGAERIARLRGQGSDLSAGARMLECLIAWSDAMSTVPAEECVARALRGLGDNVLIDQANGSEAFADGCWVLAAADRDDVLSILDASRAQAYQRGSIHAATVAAFYQAVTWLWRGSLAEADAACQELIRLNETVRQEVGRSLVAALLAEVLVAQGRLSEASAALAWAGPPEALPNTAHVYWLLEARARVQVEQGHIAEGLEAFLTVGRRLAAHAWTNPAFLPWRSGAAAALLTLGRIHKARVLAAEELALARRWGAPRALARALTVSGLAVGGDEGLRLLSEAVAEVAGSQARLEHAQALVELGAALRRSGRRVESREPLRQGADLALVCGAAPLVERARTELRASGARPRRLGLSGPDALTPSERRIAQLAASGQSNRAIAQTLFVTAKTIEVHLTSTYQKLQVNGRHELAGALGAPTR